MREAPRGRRPAEDGDCQDARAGVLICDDDDRVVEFADARGCRLVRGTWVDPDSPHTFTDARQLNVDRFVPLENAQPVGARGEVVRAMPRYANWVRDRHSTSAERTSTGCSDLSFGSSIAVTSSACRGLELL